MGSTNIGTSASGIAESPVGTASSVVRLDGLVVALRDNVTAVVAVMGDASSVRGVRGDPCPPMLGSILDATPGPIPSRPALVDLTRSDLGPDTVEIGATADASSAVVGFEDGVTFSSVVPTGLAGDGGSGKSPCPEEDELTSLMDNGQSNNDNHGDEHGEI